MLVIAHSLHNEWKRKGERWFYSSGQYWILAIFALVTMLSYRGRWFPQMSPIDEGTYLDLIYKFPDNLVAPTRL